MLKLIDWLDAGARWYQRRGGNWADARLHINAGILVTGLAVVLCSGGFSAARLLVAGGAWVLLYLQEQARWRASRDYPDNVRKTEQLNLRVLADRERLQGFSCLVFGLVGFALVICAQMFAAGSIDLLTLVLHVINLLLILADWFDRFCFYVGPGERSRQRQDVALRGAATESQ